MNCPKCGGMLVREQLSTMTYPIHEDTIRCVMCGLVIYNKPEVNKYELKRI